MGGTTKKRYVIVNADDFGLSVGVNRGIMEAVRAGVVSSATIMVNMPGFYDAVTRAKKCPRLGVGLHFNLTYGSPICQPHLVPSLVNELGHFSYEISKWKPVEVRRELRAQWNRLVAIGIEPTHIDSHQHIQMHRPVYRMIARFAHAKGVPLRRVFYPPLQHIHPLTTDRFITAVYFRPGSLPRLLRKLRHISPGVTEIHCHVGHVDPVLRTIHTWTHQRESELAVWLSPAVKRVIRAQGLTLIHFGHLKTIRQGGRRHGVSS